MVNFSVFSFGNKFSNRVADNGQRIYEGREIEVFNKRTGNLYKVRRYCPGIINKLKRCFIQLIIAHIIHLTLRLK